jgi:sialidase-1
MLVQRVTVALLILLAFGCTSPPAAEIIEATIAPATESNRRNTEGDIVVLRDGSLYATWSEFYGGNRDDSSARIVTSRSSDGGQTWSERIILQENIGEQNVMSVSLIRSQSSDILMFFGVKNSPEDLHFYTRRSTDDAQSWSEPLRMHDEPGYFVMNNDRVIQLKDGRLLAPMAFTEKVWTSSEAFRTVVYYSDDDGRTWTMSPTKLEAPKRGAMEPGLLEMPDGRILQIIRTQLGMNWHSYSSDRGETWSEASPWTVAAPESPSTLIHMPGSDDLLLIYNPNVDLDAGHGGARTPLVGAVSRDGGKTWSEPRMIEPDPEATYAYTSATVNGDRVLLTYYYAKDQLYSLRFKSIPAQYFGVSRAEQQTGERQSSNAILGARLGISMTIEIPGEIQARLAKLAEKTGLATDQHTRKALLDYLDDHEDALIATQRLEKGNARIRFEDLERELGLER